MLPRHTKVVVVGNKRTKPTLLGLRGVVKEAIGRGGWHTLVLANGVEVKLQRNALSVIEAPTLNEDDDGSMIENDLASNDTRKSHKPTHHVNKSSGSPHKPVGTSFSSNSRSGDSVSMRCCGSMKIDLGKLEMASLWRYCRRFNLNGDNLNPSREQLVEVVKRHFMSHQLDEKQVIPRFVQAAKRLKTSRR